MRKTMKKYFILMASAALMLAVSCNKEEVNTPATSNETELITVQINPETKTSLNGFDTIWSAEDAISVTVGGENIGTLTYTGEGNEFSGEVEAGHSGAAILNYPAGVTEVPAIQVAKENSFAEGAALLEGTTTMDDLRAGEGVTLNNTTALLKFSVAQAGDVTFEVGAAEYTVTGCETGNTYYACVAPAADVNFVARIDGYLSKAAANTVSFPESQITDLGTLPEPTVKVYMKPSSGWASNAKSFAAYVWNSYGNTWYEMADTDEDGVYEAAISIEYDNIIFVSQTEAFVAGWNNIYQQTADLVVPTNNNNAYVIYNYEWTTLAEAQAFEEPAKVCKLIVKVSTDIDWYNKFIYCWTSGSNTAGWPGTQLIWDKQDGNYYVYYHDFPYSLNGKKIDFCISNGNGGANNQTNDLYVTLNGEETTFTVETSDVKK